MQPANDNIPEARGVLDKEGFTRMMKVLADWQKTEKPCTCGCQEISHAQ